MLFRRESKSFFVVLSENKIKLQCTGTDVPVPGVVNFRLRCELNSKWTWKSIPSSVIVVDNSDQQLSSTRIAVADLPGV